MPSKSPPPRLLILEIFLIPPEPYLEHPAYYQFWKISVSATVKYSKGYWLISVCQSYIDVENE